jgi:hypothetical protein
MAEADRLTIAGARRSRADGTGWRGGGGEAIRRSRHGRVAVFRRASNNGGDGFVAARVLAAQEFANRAWTAWHVDRLRGDAALAAKSWTGKILAVENDLDSADLIDALFGAGRWRSQLAGQGFGCVSMNGQGRKSRSFPWMFPPASTAPAGKFVAPR